MVNIIFEEKARTERKVFSFDAVITHGDESEVVVEPAEETMI